VLTHAINFDRHHLVISPTAVSTTSVLDHCPRWQYRNNGSERPQSPVSCSWRCVLDHLLWRMFLCSLLSMGESEPSLVQRSTGPYRLRPSTTNVAKHKRHISSSMIVWNITINYMLACDSQNDLHPSLGGPETGQLSLLALKYGFMWLLLKWPCCRGETRRPSQNPMAETRPCHLSGHDRQRRLPLGPRGLKCNVNKPVRSS
jgi:hypothetical protein